MQNKIKIDSKKIAISEVSTERLEQFFGDLLNDMAIIKSQLDFAKSEASQTGKYRDGEWFNNARLALRLKGREHQLVSRELGKRSKKEREFKSNRFEQRFINVARRILKSDVFEEIMKEVTNET